MTYETILSCPNCGHEHRLVAENVVAELAEARLNTDAARNALRLSVKQHAEAREALRRYGEHDARCEYVQPWPVGCPPDAPPPCTCGLFAALRAAEGDDPA